MRRALVFFAAEFKIQEDKGSNPQVFQIQDLLRQERRSGAVALVGIADSARVELDPVVVAAEARSAGELAIGARCELIARTVHVQLFPTDEPFGVSQNNGTDCDTTEAELVGHKDLTGPTDGLAAVTHAELGGDD